MKIKCLLSAILICTAAAFSASAEGDNLYIANNGFDQYLTSWNCEGDGVWAEGWGLNGEDDIQLKFWIENSKNAKVDKKIYVPSAGKYEISAYVRGGGDGAAYMYGKSGGNTVKNTSYTSEFQIQTVEIDVTNGWLELGFAVENGRSLWYNVDAVQVKCIQAYPAECDMIVNNEFENNTEGFAVNGAVIDENGRCGNCLYMPSGSAASAKIENVENGFYELTVFCKSDNADSIIKVSDGKCSASAVVPYTQEWKKVTVSGIYSENNALMLDISSGGNLYIDSVSLKKSDKYRRFVTGGDITMANYVENCGAKFYDEDGVEGDCVKILADSGMNMARVRVYNQTGRATATDKGYGTFYLPDGVSDKKDALDLCRRAADNGMEIQFTFHYSDFWTNGEQQEIPLEWRKLIQDKSADEAVSILEEQVYLYTLDIMRALKEQGTIPQLISIGNEIQSGMLYPYGNIAADGTNWNNLARFINAGYRAVKEVAPTSKVVLHLDECGNFDKYKDYFTECAKNNIQYDVIGASYYPYWSKTDINHAVEFCNTVTDYFDKDIIIMETGYNFNPVCASGYTGQLADNGCYEEIYPPTFEGHKRFMADLFNGLKSIPRCIGDLYWDPIMVNCEGVGWAKKINTVTDSETGNVTEFDNVEGNVISNTTLFDFNGKAIPTLKVFENTYGANYMRDISVNKSRFTAVEQNGRVKLTNLTDNTENIVVLKADYQDGRLKGVKVDKYTLKPNESESIDNGTHTYVWTEQDIQPVTAK